MEDTLIAILQTINTNVRRQGSITDTEQYPQSFFTFWNDDSPDHAHYDNDNYGTDWVFSVNAYSTDPAETYQMISDARDALKAAGWVVTSRGYDVTSDVTSHTGRGFRAEYLET